MNTDSEKKHAKHLKILINQGDFKAFRTLFDLYYERLVKFAFRYTYSQSLSEEIVQEIFCVIWENKKKWNPSNVNAWLYSSIRNKALDYQRHEKVKEKNELEIKNLYSQVPTPFEVTRDLELEVAVKRAIAELPERCRTTFILHRQEELSYQEISQTMKVSVKTVETQISRALRLLREKLKNHLPFLMFFFL